MDLETVTRLNALDITQEQRDSIALLLDRSSKIDFGKRGRIEGYIDNDDIYPRCTSVLNYDGSKAVALMDWSKREVVKKMNNMLNQYLSEGFELNRNGIDYVCKQALNEPDRIKEEAADIGSEFHDNCELMMLGKEYNKLPRVEEFAKFWKDSGYQIIATELRLIWKNDILNIGFGGQCDILACKDKKILLADLKSSKAIHGSYALQLSSYGEAIKQMCGLQVDEHRIFHYPDLDVISETQKKEFNKRGHNILIKNTDKAFHRFLNLLELYRTRNEKYF